MPHTENQKGVTPPDQSSYQNHQTEPELMLLAEREEVESSSEKAETVVGNWKASQFFVVVVKVEIMKEFQDSMSSLECSVKTVGWMGM